MKKITLLVGLCLLAVACDTKTPPKSQDVNGNCKQAFLDSYNQIQSSSFDIQTAEESKKAEIETATADACRSIFKTYGTSSETCLATDTKTGKQQPLSTQDVRETCAKTIKSNYYSVDPQN